MSTSAMPRLAVVGHIEWVHFLALDSLPLAGQITPARRIRENAGGGAVVAAAAMAALGASVEFFGAFGDDELACSSRAELERLGITVHAARRPSPTREVITLIDAGGERSILTIGERLQPELADALPWERLSDVDGVYFTAGDRGALTAARAAHKLVATPRVFEQLGAADVNLDALVYSADDAVEVDWAAKLAARSALQVVTEGEHGGYWTGASSGRWRAVPPPGAVIDSYGAGDSFAAGITFGLASGEDVAGAARIAARIGARALTRAGGP